jgi:hypothetical protein
MDQEEVVHVQIPDASRARRDHIRERNRREDRLDDPGMPYSIIFFLGMQE